MADMVRRLTVTTAAESLALLSIAELRAAVRVSDGSKDTALEAMGLRVAASIMSECSIAVGSGAPPTLLRETLLETIRMQRYYDGPPVEQLTLSRRHEVAIASIVEDGTTLDATEYEVDPESGIVTRLCNDWPTCWLCWKVTVAYDAGFETVPDDLKQAAVKTVASFWAEAGQETGLKRVDVPGVLLKEYWVSDKSDGLLPLETVEALKRFRNAVV